MGADVSENLRHRLADLRSATNVEELPFDKPFAVDDSGRFALALPRGVRIVFTPGHTNTPKTGSGDVDWLRVSRIKILQIEGIDEPRI